MESLPLVTVVVPCRNEEASIAAALEAVAAQTYPIERMEVVVVDGASADRTQHVAKEMLGRYPFARCEVVENTVGATPSNLNRGLDWARGDVLVRIDARSRPPVDYVETLVGVLSTRDDIAVCGGSQIAERRSDRRTDVAIARALNNRLGMGGARYRRAGAASGPTDTAYLGVFRTAQLRSVGGWNPDYPTNQDFELNQRMTRFGQVWFQAELPVGYVPRAKVAEIFRQYRRFGGWKVRYWRDGHRPQPRQMVLIAAPAGALAVASWAIATGGAPAALGLMAAGVGGALVIDLVGADGDVGPLTRLEAGAINLLIGAAWFGGILEAVVRRPTIDRSPIR